jgi:hypothetical protein
MATMITSASLPEFREEIVQCPYCMRQTTVQAPSNYEPVYVFCRLCGKRFIIEGITFGMDVFRTEDAPRCSDPDCHEIETGQGQED